MLVWQVFHWYFHTIDLNTHVAALGEEVDIAARAEYSRKGFVIFLVLGQTVCLIFWHRTHMSAIFIFMCFCSTLSFFSITMNFSSGVQS